MEREVRKTLRDLAQFEMPKKLLLLPADFSVETGELTPTLKVKRRVVESGITRRRSRRCTPSRAAPRRSGSLVTRAATLSVLATQHPPPWPADSRSPGSGVGPLPDHPQSRQRHPRRLADPRRVVGVLGGPSTTPRIDSRLERMSGAREHAHTGGVSASHGGGFTATSANARHRLASSASRPRRHPPRPDSRRAREPASEACMAPGSSSGAGRSKAAGPLADVERRLRVTDRSGRRPDSPAGRRAPSADDPVG